MLGSVKDAASEQQQGEKQMPKVKYRVVVIPDMHFPYHDRRVWRLILKVVRGYSPSHVVIIGDFIDGYAISSHLKVPKDSLGKKSKLIKRESLAGEIASARKGLKGLRKAAEDAKIVFCEGNHEDRLTRYLAKNAPQMLPFGQMKALLGLKELGIEWIPYRQSYTLGKMHFTHDVGRFGKNAISQSLTDYGGNLTFGHTHRLGSGYQGTFHGNPHVCLNVGWGGDLDAIDYRHERKAHCESQHGFGIVEIDSQGNSWANAVPIVHGDTDSRCVVGGFIFSVRGTA